MRQAGSATVCLLMVILTIGSVSGQNSKGGGGREQKDIPAEFIFPLAIGFDPDDPNTGSILTGDSKELLNGDTIYQNRSELYPDVVAYFMGSGNPKLTVDDPERNLWIRFDHGPDGSCGVAGQTFYVNGDSLWFSQLANQEDWRDPDDPTQVDPKYQDIDGRFLGMTGDIDEGYSMMILRFILPDESGKDFLWKAVFGDYPGATNPDTRKTRVRVTVTDRDSAGNPVAFWIQGIDGFGNSVARVRSGTLKGKSESHDWGFCQTFIDYDIRVAQ